MKDSYSFDIDPAGLDLSYQKHYDTYCRIFDRCGLSYVVVEAHSGAMGGSQSHEFMVYTDAGEDLVASCSKCKYAANLEKATSRLEPVEDLPGDGRPEEVSTPGQRTIEEVSRYLGVSPKQKIKTLAYMLVETDENGGHTARPLVVLMRGDHALNEAKLSSATQGRPFRPMHPEEIQDLFKSPAGYLGPVGVNWATHLEQDSSRPILLADKALESRRNLIAGANKEDFHLKNLTPGRDFQPTAWADLRLVNEGEGCPNCGTPLRVAKAVEIGHIFKLGYKYSESMGARVLDRDGKEVAPIMGSYGIGIERILTAAIEQNNDQDGFWLPPQVAPFEVIVVPTNVSDGRIRETAENITRDLEGHGYDALLDDRDERPGVKFKDADLVGIPFRINVGKKVTEGKVEVVRRSTRESHDATIGQTLETIAKFFRLAHQTGEAKVRLRQAEG